MTKLLSLEVLSAVGLGSVLALEHAWHWHHFRPAQATLPLLWYAVFAAIFTVFPFVFRRQFAQRTIVWAVSALAAPLHFFLLYDAVRRSHPTGMLGLSPALLALPSLLELYIVLKKSGLENPARMSQLALFGVAALFFITLIFPIQFDRQWITIGWASGGRPLLAISACSASGAAGPGGRRTTGSRFRAAGLESGRVGISRARRHAHLQLVSLCYGATVASLLLAGHLLAPPRDQVFGRSLLPLLYTLAGILSFFF